MFRRRRPAERGIVHSVSSLPTSIRDDQDVRQRNYLISMGIRTVSFAVVGLCAINGWTLAAWVFVALAVLLPFPAVVVANASANRKSHFMQPVTPVELIGTPEDRDPHWDDPQWYADHPGPPRPPGGSVARPASPTAQPNEAPTDPHLTPRRPAPRRDWSRG